MRFSLVGMNDFGHWNRMTRASRALAISSVRCQACQTWSVWRNEPTESRSFAAIGDRKRR